MGPAGPTRLQGGNPVSRFFGAISLFVRQILDELRKVVRPTGPELVRYTTVVVVFVMVMMGIGVPARLRMEPGSSRGPSWVGQPRRRSHRAPAAGPPARK